MSLNQEELVEARANMTQITQQMEFSHSLLEVSFGDKKSQKEMVRRFGSMHVTSFSKSAAIGLQQGVSSCYYYMKAVPHSFYVGGAKVSKETFQYSINYMCDASAKTIGGYQVALVYDMSAVGIVYKLEDWSLLQLLISIAAIVTGVYVIMRLIYSVFSYFC